MATLTGQTVASSYEQLLHVDRDGGGNSTTHVSVKDGDNGTTFGFTIATDALMMSSTNRLEFGDTGTYINQSGDGILNITSDTEVEINATTIDINGAVAMDGAITGGTNITISGELDAATLDISGNADIDGTLEADAITVDSVALDEYIADTIGAMVGSNTESGITVAYQDGDNTLDFTVATLNQDTTGTADNITVSANNSTDETVYPVFVDGATGSQGAESDTGLTYNPSSGDLAIGGELAAATLDISGNIDIDGTANLDNTDIDGTLTQDAGNVVFNEDSGDYDFRVESNGNANMLFVDGGNNRVGFGTGTPSTDVHIYSTSDNAPHLLLENF